jgi:hypothetical protein
MTGSESTPHRWLCTAGDVVQSNGVRAQSCRTVLVGTT